VKKQKELEEERQKRIEIQAAQYNPNYGEEIRQKLEMRERLS